MAFDFRRAAIAITGFCTFLNLYAPQALLPELSREFGVGPAEISSMITAGTLAIALTAPFTGAIADVLGRKRLITAAMFAAAVPTVMVALAGDVQTIVAWRFIQGLLLPPIFTVALAYVGDEWPPAQVAGVAGIYVMGSSIGGFCGRLIPGLLSEAIGWRASFVVLAAISLVGAVVVVLTLPRETRFRRSEGFLASGKQMLRHLATPRLLAIYAVGFGVLFNFIAVFTYVSFHLAAPPYDFTPGDARVPVRHLSCRHRRGARDRLGGDAVRPAPARALSDGDLGRGPRPSARPAGRGDHSRPRAVRRLRDDLPGDLDRLRHRDDP